VLDWNGDEAAQAAKEEAARRILRSMVYYLKAHKRRLGVSNPAPYEDSSRPGEYPRKRTGNLIANVTFAPSTVQEVIDAGFKIRAGLAAGARYGAILELAKSRLGFIRTMDDLEDLLRAMLGQKSE